MDKETASINGGHKALLIVAVSKTPVENLIELAAVSETPAENLRKFLESKCVTATNPDDSGFHTFSDRH